MKGIGRKKSIERNEKDQSREMNGKKKKKILKERKKHHSGELKRIRDQNTTNFKGKGNDQLRELKENEARLME